jgi:Flp pilus assembly protein TadG
MPMTRAHRTSAPRRGAAAVELALLLPFLLMLLLGT